MIRLQQLGKSFEDGRRGRVEAVRNVTFEAHAGEIFGLLGSNGAGKTTLMRILATILKPTAGRAEIAGHDVASRPADVRRNIGFLSGDMGSYHRLTPRETIRIFGELNGLSGRELQTRTEALIDQFGMHEYADARTDRFSTGMRQRAALARTLVHDPPVLILDEPTSGLDVPTGQVIEGFIRDARAAGKCVLLSTHAMEEAEYLCDRIAVMHGGRLHPPASMDELRRQTGKQRLREVFLALLEEMPA